MEQMMEYVPNMYATFWALVPPLVAIILWQDESFAICLVML